jgi:hypothetical protein
MVSKTSSLELSTGASIKLKLRLLLPLLCILATGCGGTFSGTNGQSTASANFTIHWPDHQTRMIHDRANQVEATITKNGVIIAQKMVSRPQQGQTSTLSFPNIPIDTPISIRVWAEDTALKDANLNLIKLSEATTTVTLHPGSNSLNFALISDTTQLDVSGIPSTAIQISDHVQLGAVAKNANGDVVLNAPGQFTWTVANPNIASIDSNGMLIALQNGTTSFQVTEKGNETQNAFSKVVSFFVGNSSGLPNSYKLVLVASGHTNSWATGINSDGTVSGYFYDSPGNISYPFTYNSGSGLRALDTTNIPGFNGGTAVGINDVGDVVGNVHSGVFIWNHDGTSYYASHTGQGTALSMNSSGAFTGVYRESSNDDFGPAYWASASSFPIEFSTSTRSSGAYIANSGHIAYWNGSQASAFVGTPGNWSTLTPPSGTSPVTLGLNNSDVVVGYGIPVINGPTQACIWDSRGRTDLGLGQAISANDLGWIAGLTINQNQTYANSFIWTKTAGLVNLTAMIVGGDSGFSQFIPSGINNSGWIAGTAMENNQVVACLLIPQ